MTSNHNVTFIIPHKGRENYLEKTLESIAQQEIDLDTISVIVVTQNRDLSSHILSFKEKMELNFYHRPESETISQLRNFGVSQSNSSYLAFLDADVYLSENWVSRMLDLLMQNSSRVLVSAAQKNGQDAPPLEKMRTVLSNAVVDEPVNFLPGRNLFLARETFDRVGGFPEHLITCEDYYFTDRVNQLGELYYSSAATYIHLGEDKELTEMFKKEIWRGQSNLQSIKGRNIPLTEIPSFLVPIVISSGLIFALLFLFMKSPIGFYLSLLISTTPLIIYILRLYRLAKGTVKLKDIVAFYLYYFPARAIGTIAGLFKALGTKTHS